MADQRMADSLLAEVLSDAAIKLRSKNGVKSVRVGLTTLGSELGAAELIQGAEMAMANNLGIEAVLIGEGTGSKLETYSCADEEEQHHTMEELLSQGKIDGCVTAHYPFPIGVATVGRIITPGRGKEVFLATSTGTSDTDRVQAMVKNAVYGVAAAKSAGIARPKVGILNVDGARQVEQHLEKMRIAGYDLEWGSSKRAEGGRVLRGNDLLMGSVDVAVTDTLTGNLLMKIFSAYTSGGDYETLGYGYGPGIGPDFKPLIMIISRASGAPLVAGAIKYCADMVRGNLRNIVVEEIKKAERAGWRVEVKAKPTAKNRVEPPPVKVTTAQIAGIDIMQLDEAMESLWDSGIFAASGMGCTGPVLLVAEEDQPQARAILKEKGFAS